MEENEGFYHVLSDHYDTLFGLDPDTVSFLREKFSSGGPVVDAACGTGTYAIALAGHGIPVAGIDLDADMIRIAAGKLDELPHSTAGRLRFVHGSMEDLPEYLKEMQNGVYCIGNSLIHLEDVGKILAFLKGVHRVLNREGILIIQILNYDRILDHTITELPPLSGPGIRMLRRYSLEKGKGYILFTATLIKDGDSGTLHEVTVPLLPVRKKELVTLTESGGFSDIKVFGSFTGATHGPESFVTILTARK